MRRDEAALSSWRRHQRALPAEDARTLVAVRGLVERGDEVWVVVTGSSMRPTLEPGDRVLLAFAGDTVVAGDIVLTDVHGRPMLHRVVSRRDGVLLTLGDGCLRADPPVELLNVVARAEAVHSVRGTSALRATMRFGFVALVRYIAIKARVRAVRLWRSARYPDEVRVASEVRG
jgi:hypothetical protein